MGSCARSSSTWMAPWWTRSTPTSSPGNRRGGRRGDAHRWLAHPPPYRDERRAVHSRAWRARSVVTPHSGGRPASCRSCHGQLFRELAAVAPAARPGAVGAAPAPACGAGWPHGIATSGQRPDIDASLAALGDSTTRTLWSSTATDVVTREARARPLPWPARTRLGVGQGRECYVVGDAVWDMLGARRARMLRHRAAHRGLRSGDELLGAGAYQVYRDAEELDSALDELGVLP